MLRNLINLQGALLVAGFALIAASAGLYAAGGEPIVVTPVLTDVGEGAGMEERTFTVQVKNRSDRPIRLAGGWGC